MELYIRIKNGQPFEHPISGENLKQAFPHVDTNNLPAGFAKFVRVAPTPPEFQNPVGSTYVWDGNVVTEVWSYKLIPNWEEELAAKEKMNAAGSAPNVIG